MFFWAASTQGEHTSAWAHECTDTRNPLAVASGHLLDEHTSASLALSRMRFALLPSSAVSETDLRFAMTGSSWAEVFLDTERIFCTASRNASIFLASSCTALNCIKTWMHRFLFTDECVLRAFDYLWTAYALYLNWCGAQHATPVPSFPLVYATIRVASMHVRHHGSVTPCLRSLQLPCSISDSTA